MMKGVRSMSGILNVSTGRVEYTSPSPRRLTACTIATATHRCGGNPGIVPDGAATLMEDLHAMAKSYPRRYWDWIKRVEQAYSFPFIGFGSFIAIAMASMFTPVIIIESITILYLTIFYIPVAVAGVIRMNS